jgi:hypothetical protein
MPQKGPWEEYQKTERGPWEEYQTQTEAPQIPPSLLASRQAASKSEFEANQPESTILTRAREAGIGLLEPFALQNLVPSTLSTIGRGFKAAFTANPMEMLNLVKGAVEAPIQPVKTFAQAVSEGDYDKAALGAGGILSQTVPAAAQVGSLAGRIRQPGPGTAQELYRASLKPSTTLPPERIAQMVETGLKEQIPINLSGPERLQALKEGYEGRVTNLVQNAPGQIQPTALTAGLPQLRRTFQTQMLPESDVGTIDRAQAEFLRQHQIPGVPATPPQSTGILDPYGNPVMRPGTPAVPPQDIPLSVPETQALKVGTYRQLKKKAYGELKGS